MDTFRLTGRYRQIYGGVQGNNETVLVNMSQYWLWSLHVVKFYVGIILRRELKIDNEVALLHNSINIFQAYFLTLKIICSYVQSLSPLNTGVSLYVTGSSSFVKI